MPQSGFQDGVTDYGVPVTAHTGFPQSPVGPGGVVHPSGYGQDGPNGQPGYTGYSQGGYPGHDGGGFQEGYDSYPAGLGQDGYGPGPYVGGGQDGSGRSKRSLSLSGFKLPFSFDRRTVIALAVAFVLLVVILFLRPSSGGDTQATIVADITKELDNRKQPGEVSCPDELPDKAGATMTCTVVYDNKDSGTQQVIVTRKDDAHYSWEYGPIQLPADATTTVPPAAPTSTP
jgi:hypothetical protein